MRRALFGWILLSSSIAAAQRPTWCKTTDIPLRSPSNLPVTFSDLKISSSGAVTSGSIKILNQDSRKIRKYVFVVDLLSSESSALWMPFYSADDGRLPGKAHDYDWLRNYARQANTILDLGRTLSLWQRCQCCPAHAREAAA
jgi:hypothetical protein